MDEIIYHLIEGKYPGVKELTKTVAAIPLATDYKKIGEKFNVNYLLGVYKKIAKNGVGEV